MGINSFWFNVVLVLHVLSAIVGFGGVMLNGVYASRARALPPDQALAVMETNTFVSLRVAEWFIYAVPVFGLGLVGMSDGGYTFGQTWVWLSIVLYALALVLSLFGLQPRVHQLVATQRELVAAGPATGGPPPQAARMESLGGQVGALSGALHLIMVVILVLMVWKPGLT